MQFLEVIASSRPFTATYGTFADITTQALQTIENGGELMAFGL